MIIIIAISKYYSSCPCADALLSRTSSLLPIPLSFILSLTYSKLPPSPPPPPPPPRNILERRFACLILYEEYKMSRIPRVILRDLASGSDQYIPIITLSSLQLKIDIF